MQKIFTAGATINTKQKFNCILTTPVIHNIKSEKLLVFFNFFFAST